MANNQSTTTQTLEAEVQFWSELIDERFDDNSQQMVTNDARILAFQLRNFLLINDANVKVTITPDGIQYSTYQSEDLIIDSPPISDENETEEITLEDLRNFVATEASTSTQTSQPRYQFRHTTMQPQQLKREDKMIAYAIRYFARESMPGYMPARFKDIIDGLTYHWQQFIACNVGRTQQAINTLYHHYGMGLVLQEYQQDLYRHKIPIKDIKTELRRVLLQVTGDKHASQRYRACIRLAETFEQKPTVLKDLDAYLSITRLAKMDKANYQLFKTEIQDTISQIYFRGAQAFEAEVML
jgi:hypothetical protein